MPSPSKKVVRGERSDYYYYYPSGEIFEEICQNSSLTSHALELLSLLLIVPEFSKSRN
jgi:hypothetical protein